MPDRSVDWSVWSQFVLKSIETLTKETTSLWESVRSLGEDSAGTAEIIKAMSQRQEHLENKLDKIIEILSENKIQPQNSNRKTIAVSSAIAAVAVTIFEIIKNFF